MNRPLAQGAPGAASAADPASAASHAADPASAASQAADPASAAVPPLPAAGANSAAFQPEGVFIHLIPMNMVRRPLVQVRLGTGPDCPVVRPPATLWFGSDGRLQAVASPSTESEADDQSIDVDDDDDDDDEDDEDDQIDVDGEDDDDVAGNDDDDGIGNTDDEDEVVYLGEVRKSSQA